MADDRAAEAEEREVEGVVAFPADPQPSELVEPGERPFHDPAVLAQS